MSYKIPKLALHMIEEDSITLARRSLLSDEDSAAVAHALIGSRPVEHMIAMIVDAGGNITAVTTVSQGGMSSASVRAADILRAVLVAHGAAFVLAHNHPSGDPTPSQADIRSTDMIRDAAEVVGLTLLSHVIVTRKRGEFRSI